MELLLNLVWMFLALVALSVFMRRRHKAATTPRVPYGKALLALACVLVMLFPVVSASDDLHPTQAVLEDATKRIQQLAAPLHRVQCGSLAGTVPPLLAVYLLCALVVLHVGQTIARDARVIDRARPPHDGRSPPHV